MATAHQILEAFQEMTTGMEIGRDSFDLKNGTHFEGYIIEVADNHIVYGDGGPMASQELIDIPLDAIDLNTLSFYDCVACRWMEARYDEALDSWSVFPSFPQTCAPAKPIRKNPWWKFWL